MGIGKVRVSKVWVMARARVRVRNIRQALVGGLQRRGGSAGLSVYSGL